MAIADDGRAERLAPWIRAMDLTDQVFITGATLVLEDIRQRRGTALPAPFDEALLREGSLAEAFAAASSLATTYDGLPPHEGPDGVDEHRRIASLSSGIADRIARYLPGVR